MPKLPFIPLGLGFLDMVAAITTHDVAVAILGLGLVLMGVTALVLHKLNEIRNAIRDSDEKTETVLKQWLH